MAGDCEHASFEATVEVNRLLNDGEVVAFSADVRVSCADCDEPFVWSGLPVGLSPLRPMVSMDGRELRAPLRPSSSPPDFGRIGPGFHVEGH